MMMMNGDAPRSAGGSEPRSAAGSDPESFVILPEPPSLQTDGPPDGHLHGPRSLMDLQASMSQGDMSLEDAMTKVVDLMKENQDLKETVKGHTELMKRQFQVMADLKEKWNADQEEMRMRHQQAKDVVMGLRESLLEKDAIITELRQQKGNQRKSEAETSVKQPRTPDTTAPAVGGDGMEARVKQLESDNAQLLQSKMDLGQEVQKLTDELLDLRDKYARKEEPEEVIVSVSKEGATASMHLNTEQLQQKVDVLQEEMQKHIETIEAMNRELNEAGNIKVELENEYIKLSEEHFMLKNAMKEDTDMMRDSHASVVKIRESYEKLMKEKQELVAINNQMALQIASLQGSPVKERAPGAEAGPGAGANPLDPEKLLASPVEESTTSEVLFQREDYLKERERAQRAAVTAGLTAGELASPLGDFTTVTLSGPVDLFINQHREEADKPSGADKPPSLGQELKQAEKLQTGAEGKAEKGKSREEKGKSRENQAVSDLLLQLQEERSRVTQLMAKNKSQSSQIGELTSKLRNKEHELVATSKSREKISVEREHEREQLLNRIELLKSELLQFQQEQDEPLESINGVQTMQIQIQGLITELKDSEEKYYGAQQAIDVHKERCVDLEAKLEMYQEEGEAQRARDDQLIDAMRTTITSIEEQLAAQKQDNQKKTLAMQELRTSHDQLCSDYHELIKDIEESKEGVKARPEELEKLRREYQGTVDSLTAKLITTEDALLTQRQEFLQMRANWNEMKADVETVPVLKAQAEVFKSDFEAERKAREEMAAERDELKDTLLQMQQRNQQMLDEMQTMSATQVSELQRRHGYMAYTQGNAVGGGAAVGLEPHLAAGPSARQLLHMRENIQHQHQPPDLIEEGTSGPGGIGDDQFPHNLRERSPFDVQRTVAANATNTRQEEEEEEEHGFRCPKCDISCPDYDTLNLHVNECLDRD